MACAGGAELRTTVRKSGFLRVYLRVSKIFASFIHVIPNLVSSFAGNANKVDTRVFWTSQYLMSIVWVVFSIVNLLSFSITDFTVCMVGAVLTITNTMGYIKCDKNHQKKMGSYLMTKANENLSREQMTKIGMYAMNNGGSQAVLSGLGSMASKK